MEKYRKQLFLALCCVGIALLGCATQLPPSASVLSSEQQIAQELKDYRGQLEQVLTEKLKLQQVAEFEALSGFTTHVYTDDPARITVNTAGIDAAMHVVFNAQVLNNLPTGPEKSALLSLKQQLPKKPFNGKQLYLIIPSKPTSCNQKGIEDAKTMDDIGRLSFSPRPPGVSYADWCRDNAFTIAVITPAEQEAAGPGYPKVNLALMSVTGSALEDGLTHMFPTGVGINVRPSTAVASGLAHEAGHLLFRMMGVTRRSSEEQFAQTIELLALTNGLLPIDAVKFR